MGGLFVVLLWMATVVMSPYEHVANHIPAQSGFCTAANACLLKSLDKSESEDQERKDATTLKQH